MRGHLAANDGPDVSHKPLRFAQLAPLNGLRDDQKDIVYLVVQILRAKLPPKIVAHAFGEDGIQFFHCGAVAGANAFHQAGPRLFRGLGSGLDIGAEFGVHCFPTTKYAPQ